LLNPRASASSAAVFAFAVWTDGRPCRAPVRGADRLFEIGLAPATEFSLHERLTNVPDRALNVIILSQRSLVRELLGELLRIRFGAHVIARLESLEPPPEKMLEAGVLVCDSHGLHADALDAFLKGLRASNPKLRIVQVDDSQAGFSSDDIVTAVRGLVVPMRVAHEQLTPQELEVMLAVAAGERNADIARRMRRSFKTIEKHRANLLRKLGVRTASQLTAYAIHHGLLRTDAIIALRRQT